MSDTKKCSFCGEEILAVAIKCKHCQSMLDGSDKAIHVKSIDPFAAYHTEIQGKKAGKLSVIGVIGIILGILFIIIGFIGRINGDMGVEAIPIVALGAFMSLGCFSWARR